MTEPINEEVPTRPAGPGVVEQLARDDVERKRFLKMAGRTMGGAAAATGLAAFIAACGSASSGSTSGASGGAGATSSSAAAGGTTTSMSSSSNATGDLGIVNYALTLEYLETQFYADVIKSGLFKGQTLSVLKSFGAEEAQHVIALHKAAMSMGKPAAKPTGKFPLKNAASVVKLAATVENLVYAAVALTLIVAGCSLAVAVGGGLHAEPRVAQFGGGLRGDPAREQPQVDEARAAHLGRLRHPGHVQLADDVRGDVARWP